MKQKLFYTAFSIICDELKASLNFTQKEAVFNLIYIHLPELKSLIMISSEKEHREQIRFTAKYGKNFTPMTGLNCSGQELRKIAYHI